MPSSPWFVPALKHRFNAALVNLIPAYDELAGRAAGRECRFDSEQILGRAITVAREAAVQLGPFGGIYGIARVVAEAEDKKDGEEIGAHYFMILSGKPPTS